MQRADRRRFFHQYGRSHAEIALALKRAASGHHFVQHRAQRKDVAARIHFFPFHLLGRHVGDSPDHRTLPRDRISLRRRIGQRRSSRSSCQWWRGFRQPEIEQLRAGLRQHNVPGLKVAMRDAVAVRLVEGAGKLDPVLQHFRGWQRTLFQPRRQRHALHVFHDNEVNPILPPNVVQRADVRMIQAGYGFGLALETLTTAHIVGEMRRKNLDGDPAVQPRIPRLIHLAHSAGANGRDNFVGAELRARGQGHG